MFEFFPGNYPWNLAVSLVLSSGGCIDEVYRACEPLIDAIAAGQTPGSEDLYRSWEAVVDGLVELAEEDRARGREQSAAEKYARAGGYLAAAERMQRHGWPQREEAYRKVLALFAECFSLRPGHGERVEIPYGESALPAYFVSAGDPSAPAPCVIQWNGLDSTKEMMYTSDFHAALAQRGISTLMVDTPGSGEALRLRGLTAQPDTEQWATACVDLLSDRADVDASRVGIVGWSLGGYYAPRAAAFEKRLALCVAWGANHNWGELQHRRLRNEGENPVRHYWDHGQWVWGTSRIEDFMQIASQVSLNGVVEQITVPFLITHGAHDRQIPVSDAQQCFDAATSSPKPELRIFDEPYGGVEHVSADNFALVMPYIADWIAETFAEPR